MKSRRWLGLLAVVPWFGFWGIDLWLAGDKWMPVLAGSCCFYVGTNALINWAAGKVE